MKVFVVDISGKVVNYDIALCEALADSDQVGVSLVFFCPLYNEKPKCKTRKLLNLIPQKYKSSLSIFKRCVKIVELLLNYQILLLYVLFKRPDILHFQWFPLLERASAECILVKTMRKVSPKTKVVLTIHNVYPHDMTKYFKERYNLRFKKMDRNIDRYIVHTLSTLKEVEKEFDVSSKKIEVIPHGIFKPQYTPASSQNKTNGNIVMFGYNDFYKGADILLDALQKLPKRITNTINVTIAGRTTEDYLKTLETKAKGLNVTFLPMFIPDQDLFKLIDDSDYIALPYRMISQSGVLLLSLYFRKPLLISNLPSFVETLEGFSSDMFFETEQPQSLAELMMRYIDGKIDVKKELWAIEKLNEKYSWNNIAHKTISFYQSI